MAAKVTNVVFAGLGGQGVLKASDVLARVTFANGLAVKKSELHGMSQRGGSVTSDVRFGQEVFSPMVPEGEADYLLVLAPGETAHNLHQLGQGGVLITPDAIEVDQLPHARSLNIALLGVLSTYLAFERDDWLAAIRASLDSRTHDVNIEAFDLGRRSGKGSVAAR